MQSNVALCCSLIVTLEQKGRAKKANDNTTFEGKNNMHSQKLPLQAGLLAGFSQPLPL